MKQKTTRLYQLYRLLAAPLLLYYCLLAYYTLTAAEGEAVIYAAWARLLYTFGIVPLVVALGFWVMRRTPGNVIGPALIVYIAASPSELIFALKTSAEQAQLNNLMLNVFAIPSLIVMLSHFPNGKIYPKRLRSIVYLLLISSAIATVLGFFAFPAAYGTEEAYGQAKANPFLIAPLESFGDYLIDIGAAWSALAILMSIGLVIFRYFKVTGSERKQLRWLGFGMLTAFVFAAGPHFLVLGDNPDEWATFAASFGIVALDATLLTAIGIGILFYRLWDIDVIIRRTFTYSLVSVVLVGSYLLIVFATQAVLHTFIDSESSLAVVISTLGVAVLFNPVRTRVQQVIDRLFNRKHYDADATLEAFRDNIRDAIEPEAIQGHLVQTISSTVQPATISFWGIDRQ